MIFSGKQKNSKSLFAGIAIIIFCSSCLSGFHKKSETSNSQDDHCGYIKHLKSNFKRDNEFIRFSGTTKTTRITKAKTKVIQDTIQLIVHDDYLAFYKLLESGLINGRTFVYEKEFYPGHDYEEKELPRIKHTFSIWGIKESSCFQDQTEMKKMEFVVSVGDDPDNGSIYYIEFKPELNDDNSQEEIIYLACIGMTI